MRFLILITFLTAILTGKILRAEILFQDADKLLTTEEKFMQIDSRIQANDRIKNYAEAIIYVKKGLDLAQKYKNQEKEADYELKLARFYYLQKDMQESLIHFRIYSLLRETFIKNTKNRELTELEDAYIEELNNLIYELDLNQQLIGNLQTENERYFIGQKRISILIQFGIGAIIVVALILIYNRIAVKNKSKQKHIQENKELKRLSEMAIKYKEEQTRNLVEISQLRDRQKQITWYARHIQLALLPDKADFHENLKNSFVLQIPRNTISGDFYTVHKTGHKIVLAVLDCPGHDTDAAYFTVLAYHFLKDIFHKGITTPSMILTMLDQKLKHETSQTGQRPEEVNGIKAAICEINTKTKEVEFAGAHFPLFYIHLDEIHFVKSNRFPIGDPLFSDKFYSSDHIRLSTGDMIYLASDGYYVQFGGRKNKKFMRSSLISLFKTMYDQHVSEQRFILDKVFKEWKGRNSQTDDVLVIGMRL